MVGCFFFYILLEFLLENMVVVRLLKLFNATETELLFDGTVVFALSELVSVVLLLCRFLSVLLFVLV